MVPSETPASDNNEVIEVIVPPTPENDYGTFLGSVEDILKSGAAANAASDIVSFDEAGTAKIDAGAWISFSRSVYQVIADMNRDVTIVYTYNSVKYSTTIPKGADVMSLVNEEGYCGFLNLASHYGATIVEQ